MPYSKVSTRGQVVIPKSIRDELHLEEGDTVEIEIEDGKAVMTPKRLLVVSKAPAPKLTAAEQRTLKRATEKIEAINKDMLHAKGLTAAESHVAVKVGLIDADQRWWWLESWQRGEREVEQSLRKGEVSGPFTTSEGLLDHLHKATTHEPA